jgi:lipid-A-disaccharide synthase
LSKSLAVNIEIYQKELNRFNLPVTLVENNTYDAINASDFVLAISGTSTLETAILGKPMAIIYKLPLLEYMLARPLLRLENIGLVNIVAGKQIVPEFIQLGARAEKIATACLELLGDKSRYEAVKNELSLVKNSLYPTGASRRAALSILEILK